MQESFILNQATKRLLVVGLSRTGTSLLQRLLNAYPSVFVAYESIYMPFLGKNSRHDVHAYFYEILKQHRHLCLAVPENLPPESIKAFPFIEKFDYFGDKAIYNPGRPFRKHLRKAVFSKDVDKIIFIVRDPRARILSFVKWKERRDRTYPHTVQDGSAGTATAERVVEQCKVWNQYVNDVFTCIGASSKCISIKYEELIEKPKDTLAAILDFLELELSRYPSVYLETVKGDSLFRWRDELDADSVKLADGITKPFREKLQYE